MAHHKSAKKRIRQTEVREARNKYKKVGMKLSIKSIRLASDKAEAEKIIDMFTSSAMSALGEGNTISLLGFGSFSSTF